MKRISLDPDIYVTSSCNYTDILAISVIKFMPFNIRIEYWRDLRGDLNSLPRIIGEKKIEKNIS